VEASVADAVARLTTIYSLTGSSDRNRDRSTTGTAHYEAAEQIFGPDVRLKAAGIDLREWAPQPFGQYEWPSGADYSVNRPMPYTVTGVKTYFVNSLFAGDVFVVELQLRGGLNDYIDAQRHLFDRKVTKQLAGQDLLEAAASQVGGAERDRLRGLALGQDKHQIMFLSRADAGLITSTVGNGEAPRRISDGKAAYETEKPLDLDQINFAALGRLMFKDVKINYRPAQVPISLPTDINGPDLQMVAVWNTNTVACGFEAYNNLGEDYGDLGDRRIREFVFAASQIVAAANRCREIRTTTLSVLKQVKLPTSSDHNPDSERDELIRYEGELHSLEFDLAFGADVYRGPALVQGGRPIERYQEAVRAESGFNASVELTHRMVEQLTSIVTTRRRLFEVTVSMQVARHQADQLDALNALLDRTEGVKTAGIIVATIVVVVSCIGLFATLAAVPVSAGSFLGPQFRSASVAALSVIFAGVLGFGVYAASNAHLTGRKARTFTTIAAIALAVSCLAGLVLAIVLWPHSGTAVHWYALAGGMMTGCAAIILGACMIDFGERRKRPAHKTARTGSGTHATTGNVASASPAPSARQLPAESSRSDEPNTAQ
jgi:hypothetical protein